MEMYFYNYNLSVSYIATIYMKQIFKGVSEYICRSFIDRDLKMKKNMKDESFHHHTGVYITIQIH